MLVREQRLLAEVLSELRKVLPFALVGFDTDNDSVFMNETVRDYCTEAGGEFTRSRPYRKNDQAWVEQKNGAVVRHTVGYRRYEGLEAAAALADLYRSPFGDVCGSPRLAGRADRIRGWGIHRVAQSAVMARTDAQ